MTIIRDPVAERVALDADDRPFAYSSTVIPGMVLGLDALAIVVAAAVSWIVVLDVGVDRIDAYVLCILVVLAAALVLLRRAGLYEIQAIMRPIAYADCVVIAVATAFLLFLTIAFSLKVSELYSRLWMWTFGIGATIGLITLRIAVSAAAESLSKRGVMGRNMAVLGAGEQARLFLRQLKTVRPHFTRVDGLYARGHEALGPQLEGHRVRGGPEALVEATRAGRIDDVVVAMPWQEAEALGETIERLRELPVDIYIATDLFGYKMPLRPAPGQFQKLPLFEVVQRPIAGWSSLVKRGEDLLLGSAILLLISPLMAVIAVAIKLDSAGPVLFRQKRLGFNNQEFSIYKFRSMYHAADGTAAQTEAFELQATRDDPRVTRVGRMIRRTSLDELPQIFNVLEGSMSLVGPRPHALSHNVEYGRKIRGYFARHNVKPGITGWAQVNGFRGETARLGLMEERVRHDVYYTDHWSLWLDLRILFMTALVVLFQKNAY